MKRKVRDIMWFGDPPAPVAYDLGRHYGFYQPVCPWCGENIGSYIPNKNLTFGKLYEKLYYITGRHIDSCKNKDRTDPVKDLEVEM